MNRVLIFGIFLAGLFGHANVLTGQVDVIVSGDRDSNAGPLCGIYALLGAARSLNRHVDGDTLLDGDFVSNRKGSSVQDLCLAARAVDLVAEPYKRMTLQSLRTSRHPMLLHLNRSHLQTTSRHWVLFLGDDNGMARIFDAPHEIQNRTYADVLAEWDGVAIRISVSDHVESPYSFAVSIFPALLVFLSIGSLLWIRKLMPIRFVCSSSWAVSLAMVVGVAGFANLVHWMSSTGIHRNPSSVALIAKYHYALSLPITSTEQLVRMIEDGSDEPSFAIVDARPVSAWRAGHLPNAICVPVNSTPSGLSEAVNLLSNAETVIVYCQSRGCSWDEKIARHLVFAGIDNVVLYAGGWQEWEERNQDGR